MGALHPVSLDSRATRHTIRTASGKFLLMWLHWVWGLCTRGSFSALFLCTGCFLRFLFALVKDQSKRQRGLLGKLSKSGSSLSFLQSRGFMAGR